MREEGVSNVRRVRWFVGFAVALGLGFALQASSARAGVLEIDLTPTGGPTIVILEGGALDTAMNPDTLTVNTGLLNAVLLGAGDPLRFASLGANTNNPGLATGATLTLTGEAYLLAGSGPFGFTAKAFQTDYTSPTGAIGSLQSSSSATATNTNMGDTQSFRSWFDQTNAGAKTTPSPVVMFVSPSLNGALPNTVSNSATAGATPLPGVASPFALVNEISISMMALPGGAVQPDDQFTGSTVVTAQAVPEPTSFVPMLAALPLVLGLLRRYRRKR
jgi:hypothetical protein